MELGSKFVYLGNDAEDDEEVVLSNVNGVVLSDSESDESNDDGEVCLLDILDTAGQEEYSSQKDMYVHSADGIVIIYSITDRDSFTLAESIFIWLKHLTQCNPFSILVANKQDLTSEATVTSQEGIDLALKLGIPFYETSAKTGTGVVEAMTGLVKIIPRISTDYRIVMLGGGAVGKSSITIRFTSNSFVENYDPTIEDSYRKMIRVKGLQPLSKEEKKVLRKKKKSNADSGVMGIFPTNRAASGKNSLSFVQKLFGPKSEPQLGNSMRRPPRSHQSSRPPFPESRSQSFESSPSKNKVKVTEKKTDGNVVLIALKILGDEPNLVTGDPIKCAGCLAVLTSTAVLVEDGDTMTWNCEFCGHVNSGLNISENEIPKGDSFDFMLSPATKSTADNTGEEVVLEKKKETSLGVTVYCMDISTSMNEVCHVPESHIAWREARTRGVETVAGVTRLDCIKKAIQRLTEQLKQEDPSKQVLLIAFGSSVFVKGGGSTENLPSFNSVDSTLFDNLIDKGLKLSNDYPLKTIEESHESINTAVRALQTIGCTALGPALSICAGYVSKIPGSEIVLCTDGVPNVGIGSLPDHGNGAAFYRMIGEYARSKNTTINILAVGDSAELQTVSAAAEISGGLTSRLNPVEMMRQLRLIAQNEVIATSVTVMFFLHPGFVFDEISFGENLSKLEKEIGNVRKETDISFRFKLRDPSKKEKVTSVPFQIQITYTRTDGMTCLRVLTKSFQATSCRRKMEENINVSVLGVSAMKSTARMAQTNRPTEAQHLLKNVKRLVKRGTNSDEQMEEKLAFETEVAQWDKMLTVEHDRFVKPSGILDDSVYTGIQAAYQSSSSRQVALKDKMNVVQNRAVKESSRAAYYSYKDDL